MIKLTKHTGQDVYLNKQFISSFALDDDSRYTNVYMFGDSKCWSIKESPEQIMLLKESVK